MLASLQGNRVESLVLDPRNEERFWSGVLEAERFFRRESRVHRAVERLVSLLEGTQISYAIMGDLAMNEFGYQRPTGCLEVLLTPNGLVAFKEEHLGRGYVENFPGSRGLRDTENAVDVDVLLTGGYPGDGKPKPIVFPDPAVAAERGARVALLPLPRLLELKLASGMTAPHRLKDLADVQELIRATSLPRELADSLHPYVRDKYLELWQAVREHPAEE